MRLNEEHVAQAEMVAQLRTNNEMQKRQINELNRFVWLLVKRLGGIVDMTKEELDSFPKDWALNAHWNEEKKVVEFIATTKAVDKEETKT